MVHPLLPRRAAARLTGAAAGALILALAAGCSGGVKLDSRWRDRDVTIDGRNTEWRDVLRESDEVSAGVLNDGEYLYLTVLVGDRQQQARILAGGCTLWFDASGDKRKTLGVRFPLVEAPGGGERPAPGQRPPQGELPAGGMDPARLLADRTPGFEIVTDDPVETRSCDPGTGGIEVAAGLYGGLLTYEIRMPLAVTDEHPYGIGAGPGDRIAVGIETPEMAGPLPRQDKAGGRGRPGGAPPGGGMGGGMGGPPGGGMGGPGGGRGGPPDRDADRSEPLDLWAKIKLADG